MTAAKCICIAIFGKIGIKYSKEITQATFKKIGGRPFFAAIIKA